MEVFLVVILVAASSLLSEAVLQLGNQNDPSCECVSFSNCNGTAIFGRNCPGHFDVCCRPTDIIEPCTCVPYFECTELGSGGPPPGKCTNFLDVCCPPRLIKEPCTCKSFLDCLTGQTSNETQCPGEFDLCCIDDSEAPRPTRLTTLPPPRPTTLPPPPVIIADASCSTTGTRKGICIPFNDCSDKLVEPIRLLTLEQFLQNYGCGTLHGIARICCPV